MRRLLSASSAMSEQQSEEVQQIEKLYEFSERLNASKDKSQIEEIYSERIESQSPVLLIASLG
ncbi:unnamed protein product [Arabidopsis arenosa]|uniref:Uncharacterized protein n=1 Tax=Arabidopsis arenosa TaxID=38785 RepID=A0A8S1ZK09_ARAAE|nr:unnamed protein product [Arabidopsis arenosa]